jgi:FKBP-type peptidyl-prolyl cis-trans isomerase SlpA
MKRVESNSAVSVNYTGKLEDGTIFDSSLVEGREPLNVTLGQGQLIKGFENGLLGMTVGESKSIEIESEDAYGEYLEYLIQEVPLEQMPGDVEVGTQLFSQTEMGPVNFVVKEIKEMTVVLDANHPLAGKKLVFDLQLIDLN